MTVCTLHPEREATASVTIMGTTYHRCEVCQASVDQMEAASQRKARKSREASFRSYSRQVRNYNHR